MLHCTKWSMIHFDAHPDLACPCNVPAAACFTPRNTILYYDNDSAISNVEKANGEATHNDTSLRQEANQNLYELLDSTTSGIAEWILPLVLAANLHSITWIKPSFSQQLATGNYHFAVGVQDGQDCETIGSFLDLSKNARIKVDFCHPYYLDDNSFVPSRKLVLKKNLQLQVSELTIDGIPTTIESKKEEPWILDICFDYFVCRNPYLQDVEDVSPRVAKALENVLSATKMNNVQGNLDLTEAAHYQADVANFQMMLTQTLTRAFQSLSSTFEFSRFECYFDDPVQGENLIQGLVVSSVQDRDLDKNLLSKIVEAIPNCSMPHDPSSYSLEGVKNSIQLVEEAIQSLVVESESMPFLISLSRSSEDGFTPNNIVESLQVQIIAMLHRIFCQKDYCCKDTSNETGSCSSCLQIVRDYGKWEGSTIYR